MAKFYFTENFDYRPTRRSMIAYKKGTAYTIPRRASEEALALGKGHFVRRPQKAQEPDGEGS